MSDHFIEDFNMLHDQPPKKPVALKSDHERIWLEPRCCTEGDGRTWCQDPDNWGHEEDARIEHEQPVEYIRADRVDEVAATVAKKRDKVATLAKRRIGRLVRTVERFDRANRRHAENFALMRQENGSLQAKIDRLMWEYCPGEMTTEQIEEWERNQVPCDDIDMGGMVL